MKKMIKDSLRRLPGIMAGLLLLTGTACMPESLKPGIETPGSQDRSPMTIGIGVSATEVGIRTRAEGDSRMDNYNVNSIWIGVFDVVTDSLVGSRFTVKPFDTELDENNKRIDSAKVDILYYDAHPTVRIFGVANYRGVKDGNNSDLRESLSKVKSMADLYAISVDTESADLAEKQYNAPLMMGVYKAVGAPNDFYTVKYNSTTKSLEHSYGDGMDIKLVEGFQRIDYLKLTGTIRLRRLVSQINVNVNAGDNIDLSNMRYRVFNMPTQVYLQERKTHTAEVKNFNDWQNASPNKADSLLTTDLMDGVRKVATAEKYKSEAEQSADGLSFSFYHYENKHWGQNVSDQKSREAIRTDKSLMTDDITNKPLPIFLALSPYSATDGPANDYNNFASYFEITLDVNVKDDNGNIVKSANNVTYRIHEGFVNDDNGNTVKKPEKTQQEDPQAWLEYFSKVAKDFTCVRNTLYTYNITINGLSSFNVDATKHEHTNPGVLGGAEFFTESTEEATKPIIIDPNDPENDDTYSFTNVKAAAYICYYANGGSPKYYAGGDKEGIDKLMESPILPAGFKEATEGEPIDFGFTFGEVNISDLFSPATRAGEMNTTTISGTIDTYPKDVRDVYPEDYKMSLYLLLASEDLGDDCVNNTYTYIHALPFDSRQEMGEFAFSLAFANDWDEDLAESNGAVVGHLKQIQVTEPKWKSTAELPADLKYTVFLDDKLIADEITSPLELEEEFNSYTANSVHTIKVVAEDPDNKYKPCTISQEFIVYPTTFTWDYTQISLQASVAQNSYYYGSNFTPKEGASDDIYSGIKHLLSKMTTGTQTNVGNYIQTGGTGNAFEINALYDAVLTIYPSHTGSDWSHLVKDNPSYRYLKVTSSDNSEELSYAAIPKPNAVGDLIPFTFYVKKGQVKIYTGGSLNIYKIELTYIGYPSTPRTNVWSFGETKWTGSIDYINSFKDSNPFPPISLSIDGLRLETTSAKISKGTSLIKLDGGGDFDKKERLFSFMAYKSGKLELSVADAGGDGKRYMKIKVGDQVTELEKLPASKQQTSQIYQVDIDKPTRVYITSGSGGINIYSIKFEESK